METITKQELELINSLYSRRYSGNKIISNATEVEREFLLSFRKKLKRYANYFSNKYQDFGPFETEMSSGNPVGQGTTLNNVWAGLFKGNTNKQYAAQISFVVNSSEPCLDVGFYFGSASSRKKITADEKQILKAQFLQIGKNLALSISQNKNIEERYNSLFDFGFKAYLNGNHATPLEWRTGIAINPQSSQITTKIYPDHSGVIKTSEIDTRVVQVIFLMKYINQIATSGEIIPPITPEQYIKKAERYAEIGLKGELFILEQEKIKLKKLGYLSSEYPKHVALESNNFGYDILSKNERGEEVFIEVKSTTRTSDDIYSRQFFLTNHEYETYNSNKKHYKIVRVYDVENLAKIEYMDMETVIKKSNGYIIEY